MRCRCPRRRAGLVDHARRQLRGLDMGQVFFGDVVDGPAHDKRGIVEGLDLGAQFDPGEPAGRKAPAAGDDLVFAWLRGMIGTFRPALLKLSASLAISP